MQTISGMQLVYTRVEDVYSPTHQDGFQTYYHSSSLLPADIALIEQRVNCFQPSKNDTTRHQFFILPDGNVVLTYSRSILANKKINDRYGARGMYLAHCLIFTPDEFIKTNHNPFKIFDQALFLPDAEQMVRDFNQAELREPICRFEVDPFTPTLGGEEWWSSACNLVAFASQSQAMKNNDQSLMFYGEEGEIDKALRAIFWIVPARLRLACTFDTCIDGCNIKAGQFWMVGSSAQREEPFLAIQAVGHRVGIPQGTLPAGDFYLDWLQKMATQAGGDMLPKVLTIQELNEAFINKRMPSQEVLVETVCEEFFSLYSTTVIQNLRGMLARKIQPGMSEALATYLLQEIVKKSHILAIAAAQNVSEQYLAQFVRNWLKTQAPELTGLKGGEWKALQQFASRAGDQVLLFWVGAISGDDSTRREALQKVSADDYRAALDLLFKPIPPVLYLSLVHMDILFQYLMEFQQQITDKHFLDLSQVLVDMKQTNELEKLSGRVLNLQNNSLSDLEKLLKKEKSLPPGLAQAMQTRRAQLGSPAGFLGRIIGKN